jgi:hypothetical protein
MIDLHHLIDALPPVVGSMVTLWAVASPRHWFWRSWVVFAFLLLFLLIPAHELIIAGAAQTAIVVGGMLVWRYRKQRSESSAQKTEPTQVSLRTILLFTVIFAAAMAVLGQFPDVPFLIWVRWMGPGITAGCVTLFAAWLVLGKTRLTFRVLTAFVLVLLTTAILAWMMTASSATHGWTEMWWLNFETIFSQAWLEKVAQRWLFYLPAIATGFFSVAAWTLLFCKTGWFNPFGEPEANKSRWVWGYRAMWLLETASISALPLYLFFNLITWPARPQVDNPKPAYIAHFNAAGVMISDADSKIFADSRNQTTAVLADRIKANESALVEMRAGFDQLTLENPCIPDEGDANLNLLYLLNAQIHLAERKGDAQLICTANQDHLFYIHGTYPQYLGVPEVEVWDVEGIWKVREALMLDQRQDIVARIWKLESQMRPWPAVKELMIILNEREHWQNRLPGVIQQLKVADPYEHAREDYLKSRTAIRMMLLDIATCSHQEVYGHLPKSLNELVPKFIEDLPGDPYGDGPIRYIETVDGHTFYSVGPNGIDEHGQGDDVIFQPPAQPVTP